MQELEFFSAPKSLAWVLCHLVGGTPYDNKEGKRVFVTEVVAENVQFLGGRRELDNPTSNNDGNPGSGSSDIGFDPFENGKPINISDDDLPF